MESLPIPDELLAEIFLRLPSPADLARASAACVSFRRVAADRAFLRQYRKLHPAPFLGFLDYRGVFNPADPPHSSAPAARAAALAADFSFSFLPGLAVDWVVQDVCDGRVLLDRPLLRNIDVGIVLAELVVCDPLHRRCLMLPPIPADLAPSVEDPLWRTGRHCAFLASSEDDDEETSFSVIWTAECVKKVVAFVFSSSTGQWRAASSQSWSNLFDGMLSSTGNIRFDCRHYANGCFYWEMALNENLLVLDTQRMEFSRADKPDEASGGAIDGIDIGIVEAGEGGLGMFVRVHMTSDLTYFTLRQDIGGSSSKWHKEKTVSLGSRYTLVGSRGSYLFLQRLGSSALERGCFTLDVKTFHLEKVCASKFGISGPRAYFNFPPSLLSMPRVASGTQEGAEEAIVEQSAGALQAEETVDRYNCETTAVDDADAGRQAGASRTGDGAD